MAIAFLSLGAVAPAGASAFIGESAVLNPAKTDLTGPAKTILTNPTFLPETTTEARVAKGVAEASRVAGVFQSATILPALGSVLSFGVGTVIGSEICNAIGIEGCWYFGSEGADPVEKTGGNWTYSTTPVSLPAGGETHPYNWLWKKTSGVMADTYPGVAGIAADCGSGTPNAMGSFYVYNSATGCHGESGKRVILQRDGMANRVLEHHPTDDPGISNYSHTVSPTWSNKLATALKEQPDGSPEGRLGQRIASKIEGSGVVDPYATYVTVPEGLCEGMKYPACLVEVEELELVPTQTELDWDDAVIEELDELDPQKTREEEEEKVITILPPPGTELETGSELEVVTNPSEEDMPQWVPKPDDGETAEEYKEKKVALPFWEPSDHELSGDLLNPHKGPNEVVRTTPEAGTRLNPHPETSVDLDIYHNPADAPPAAGAWSAPPVSGIDLTPLSGISIGCNDFPFGIFCWIGSGLTAWGPGGECPQLGVPFGSSIGADDELAFDTCLFEPAMEIVRPVLILLAAFSLAYLFAAAAMGFGGSTGDD